MKTPCLVLAAAWAGVLLSGCGSDSFVTQLDELSEREAIVAAPEEVTVGDRALVLETSLWRDFMPGWGNDRGLIALALVTAVDEERFPDEVDADRIYVLHESQVWVSSFSDEERPGGHEHQLERIAREGPEWGPEVSVDVVVRLSQGDGETLFLRATEQPIEAAL